MHATERVVQGAPAGGTSAAPGAPAAGVEVVLKPLSRPDLGEIRVDGVLAVGRAEMPFAGYQDDIVVMLSRRHARLFVEAGVPYVVDLESRNGTTVNRAGIGQAPCPLRDGDEVCFGGVLAYRVEVASRAAGPRPEGAFTLTLTPASPASQLQTIVVTRFPFLVSKTDAAFARERGGHAAHLAFLSRRHAHVFLKGGGAWIEDLGSTNGTFVDGLRLQESAVPLQDGALLAFGGDHFTYRVGLSQAGEDEADATRAAPTLAAPARAASPRPAAPAPAGPGTASPGAAPPAAGAAAPVPVASDAPAAAGATASAAAGAAVPAAGPEARPASSGGKTTFVAAPTSFLEIFCDPAPADEPGEGAPSTQAAPDAEAPAGPAAPAGKRRGRKPGAPRRSRAAALWSELADVLQGEDRDDMRRGSRRAITLIVVSLVLVVGLVWWAAAGRKLKDLVARGDYAEAAVLADQQLAQRPDDAELRALATEATLKTHVPTWLAKVAARDFDGASAVVAQLGQLGARNPDLKPLVAELDWLGQLQRLVAARGGPDKPIRIYADEAQIGSLIDRFNADTREHQRALARIAAYVPQFGEPYGEALTQLRRLQSEATVHFAAIERVKAAVGTELQRDRPEALVPVLKEAAEKYPGLGGLDTLRQDLDRYTALRAEARARRPQRLFALVRQARFATPPFQQAHAALAASGALPPADLVRQYEAATQAWQRGDAERAQAALQQLAAAGSWAPALRGEHERRQGVLAQFAALQGSRGAPGHDEQLLAFRTALDAEEDTHFVRATQAELDQQKDKVLARAQEAMTRARGLWQEYRAGGAIDAGQRSETTVSPAFRTRARLLADAQRAARQGLQMYAQLQAAQPAEAAATGEEIRTEAQAQRTALLELRNVLEPELLKSKLALLGDTSDDAR